MVNLLVTFKNLSRPVRWSTIAYISCLFGYNVIGTYLSAKDYLYMYRSGKITYSKHYEGHKIESDLDAVKFGVEFNACGRLYDSIIWPISVTENIIIPNVVLALNPPPVNPVKTDELVKKK